MCAKRGKARQSEASTAYICPVSCCIVRLPQKCREAEADQKQPNPGSCDREALVDCNGRQRRGGQSDTETFAQPVCSWPVVALTVHHIVDVDQDHRHRDAQGRNPLLTIITHRQLVSATDARALHRTTAEARRGAADSPQRKGCACSPSRIHARTRRSSQRQRRRSSTPAASCTAPSSPASSPSSAWRPSTSVQPAAICPCLLLYSSGFVVMASSAVPGGARLRRPCRMAPYVSAVSLATASAARASRRRPAARPSVRVYAHTRRHRWWAQLRNSIASVKIPARQSGNTCIILVCDPAEFSNSDYSSLEDWNRQQELSCYMYKIRLGSLNKQIRMTD